MLVRLQGVGLTSNLDRYITAPLLLTIARQFQLPFSASAAVASAHLLGYGLAQLPWAEASRRFGSVVTMRIALVGTGLAALAAALAPSIAWLIGARLVGGAFLGAAIPASLALVAGGLPRARQRHGFGALVSANGVGIVLAAAIGAVVVQADAWRVAYVVVGVVALLTGAATVGLAGREAPLLRAGELGRSAEGIPVLAVVVPLATVFVEGALLAGAVFVLPAVAERGGAAPMVAGLAIAVYGLAMPLAGAVLKAARWDHIGLGRRVAAASLLLLLVSVALLVLRGTAGALVPALLLGGAWSLVHPVLQEEAGHAWPGRRTYVLAGFVTCLFLGSAGGSHLLAHIFDVHGTTAVALWCACSTLLLPTVGPLIRKSGHALPGR